MRRPATSRRSTSATTRSSPRSRSRSRGPFIDDGTLVKPIAVDTTVPDGSALVKTYKVKAGDTLAGDRREVPGLDDERGVGQRPQVQDRHPQRPDAQHPAGHRAHRRRSRPPTRSTAWPRATASTGPTSSPPTGSTIRISSSARCWSSRAPRAQPMPAPKPATTKTSRPATSTARPPAVYRGGTFLWPVVGGGNYISQYFHYGHYAIDIAADYGSKVRAAAAGTVIFAGWKSNGGGYQVWIAHGSGLYTTYNHMSAISVGLRPARRPRPAGRPGRPVRQRDGPAPPLRSLARPSLGRRAPSQSARLPVRARTHRRRAGRHGHATWTGARAFAHAFGIFERRRGPKRARSVESRGRPRSDVRKVRPRVTSARRPLSSAASVGPLLGRAATRPPTAAGAAGRARMAADVPRPREDLGPRRRWW